MTYIGTTGILNYGILRCRSRATMHVSVICYRGCFVVDSKGRTYHVMVTPSANNRHHDVGTKYHFWTDNSQLYLMSELSEAGAANDNMDYFIKAISHWLITSFMYKNDSKKEMSIMGCMYRLPHIFRPLRVGDEFICSKSLIIFNHHIIINALFFYGDHVTYKGDFQRAINEAIYIYTHC